MSNESNTRHSLSGKLDAFYTSLDTGERAQFDTILRAAIQNRPADSDVAGYDMLESAWAWVDGALGGTQPAEGQQGVADTRA